jgi:hypothetical protein
MMAYENEDWKRKKEAVLAAQAVRAQEKRIQALCQAVVLELITDLFPSDASSLLPPELLPQPNHLPHQPANPSSPQQRQPSQSSSVSHGPMPWTSTRLSLSWPPISPDGGKFLLLLT